MTQKRMKEQRENHVRYLGTEAELGTSDDSEEMQLIEEDERIAALISSDDDLFEEKEPEKEVEKLLPPQSDITRQKIKRPAAPPEIDVTAEETLTKSRKPKKLKI